MADRTHRTNYDITATDRATQAFNSVKRSMGEVESAAAKVRNVLGGLGVGLSVGAFATALIRETKDAEQASARLNAVLRATGHSAGLTKGDLDDLAESMQEVFGFTDESVRKAQASLLKFGNIQGDVFREGLKLSADLAAFMGTEIPEAAQMIGKSLQSPTEGLGLMERQFGKLTAEQEKHIQTLVKEGRAIEAQMAVLDLWRQKIGGTAELMNTGLTRATRDVANAWNDMLEAIGKTSAVGGTSVQILTELRDVLRDITNFAAPTQPLQVFQQNLRGLEAELARIEKSRPDTGRSPLIDQRIAELQAQREELRKAVELLKLAGDPSTFDARDLRLRATAPVKLGGDDKAAELERKRAEEIARQLAQLSTRSAARTIDFEFEDLQKFWAGVALNAKGAVEEIRNAEEAERRFLELQRKALTAPPLDSEFEELHKFWAETAAGVRKVREEAEPLKDVARDLGFTFSSAFESAIIEGEKLRVVLHGLLQDIARIILRKTVTEPLAQGITNAIAVGLGSFGFGGGPEQLGGPRAAGGPVAPGFTYLVGEDGPELFVPRTSGSIVPNDRFGGDGTIVIQQHNSFHGDFRIAARAEIQSMMPQIAETARAATFDAMERGQRP